MDGADLPSPRSDEGEGNREEEQARDPRQEDDPKRDQSVRAWPLPDKAIEEDASLEQVEARPPARIGHGDWLEVWA